MRFLLPSATTALALMASTDLGWASKAPERPTSRVDSHVSLHLSKHHVRSGEPVLLRGRINPGGAHRVKLVVRGPDGGAIGLASKPSGAFAFRWRPASNGTYSIRAYGIHDRRIAGSASAVRRMTAYRPAAASYYGPGLYGGALACGGTLQPWTLGVAHRTLPCGVEVKLRYRGRTVSVPVIDRGPYAAGRDFDLTEATKSRLGFPDLGTLLASR